MLSSQTRVITLDPERPDPASIAIAAGILREGGLVAFPTETVYGLGADATNPDAVARIFEAKGRPSFNPLIVHVDGPEMAARYVAKESLTAFQGSLWERWWPGPVTFVHRRSPAIPDIVAAGGPTVGLRMPRAPIALALIHSLGRPLAAPSANRSTGISPTLASHVLKDLDGRIELVLDGGPANVGLESTVVDVTGERPRVLRPGPVSAAELLAIGGPFPNSREDSCPHVSPGQSRTHYAPTTRSYWVERDDPTSIDLNGRGAALVVGPGNPLEITRDLATVSLATPEEAARQLYHVLHCLDESGHDYLIVVPPPDLPEWEAIRDRLWRATVPLA